MTHLIGQKVNIGYVENMCFNVNLKGPKLEQNTSLKNNGIELFVKNDSKNTENWWNTAIL